MMQQINSYSMIEMTNRQEDSIFCVVPFSKVVYKAMEVIKVVAVQW